MTVYLVKRQHMVESINNSNFGDVNSWEYDETIAVCSTLEKAMEYVDRPNFDIIITRYEVDKPDSETLMENISTHGNIGRVTPDDFKELNILRAPKFFSYGEFVKKWCSINRESK